MPLNLHLNPSRQETNLHYVRSFYSISQTLLTFCENHHILFLEDQIIETYCHYMHLLIQDYFTEDAKDWMKNMKTEIQTMASKGYQLGTSLKKLAAIHQEDNSAPDQKRWVLNLIQQQNGLVDTNTLFSEFILMMHWDMLETMESVLTNTFGKGKGGAARLQGDALRWFLNQHLPLAFMEASQKSACPKHHFFSQYQEALIEWLGWIIGFYAALSQKPIEQAVYEKMDSL